MPRSALYASPLRERERLEVIREFLDWLYAKPAPVERQARAFWTWYFWLTPEQIAGPSRQSFDSLLKESRTWPWESLRRQWIAQLNGVLNGARLPSAPPLGGFAYRLRVWKDGDGGEYFHLAPVPPRQPSGKSFLYVVLADVLGYLNGLAVGVVGNCAECGRLFLRLRARRRLYCSQSCKQKAWARSGSHPSAPRGRRRRRPRAGEQS